MMIQGSEWEVRPIGTRWLGVCESLKLTVEADTQTELIESIGETLDAITADLKT